MEIRNKHTKELVDIEVSHVTNNQEKGVVVNMSISYNADKYYIHPLHVKIKTGFTNHKADINKTTFTPPLKWTLASLHKLFRGEASWILEFFKESTS